MHTLTNYQDRSDGCGPTTIKTSTSLNQIGKSVIRGLALVTAAVSFCAVAAAQTAGMYQVTNILSDGYVPALATDPNFIDPWGVSIGKAFWINTNVSGLDYVASTNASIAFKVTIPAGTGTATGSPTGTVFNSGTGFVLSNGQKASFLFCSLDGTISGWNGALIASGNHALIAVNNTAKSAVYTDMALLTNASGTYILAANFGQGGDVEVYDSTFKSAQLAGSFIDPNVPAGYAPYSVHTIGTQVFVTYTLRTTPPFAAGAGSYQEILGTNTGFVSVFDINGNFVSRAVTGGNLNAPWGVAIAPATFGVFGGDLLVGNFGDGLINAYDPKTFAYLGQIADGTGKPLAYPGLWEIVFGTSAYGDTNALYFSAGLAHETHGLFGSINNGPTTTATPTFALSTSTQVASVAVGASSALTISVAPTNAFTGTVNLSCTDLPAGATCNFASAQLSVLPNSPTTTTLTIQTANGNKPYAVAEAHRPTRNNAWAITSALMLPFGSILAFRRRKHFGNLRSLGLSVGGLAILLASIGMMVGCSYSSSTPATPAGTTSVTIKAISGATTKSTVVAVTVH